VIEDNPVATNRFLTERNAPRAFRGGAGIVASIKEQVGLRRLRKGRLRPPFLLARRKSLETAKAL
jgi:hypothetical protein